MKELLICPILFAFVIPVYASQPGQPLDCSDWVFLDPGLSCTSFSSCASGEGCGNPTIAQKDFDAQGRLLVLNERLIGQANCGSSTRLANLLRTELIAIDSGGVPVLGYIEDRCSSNPGSVDRFNWRCDGGFSVYPVEDNRRINFDRVGGQAIFVGFSSCSTDEEGGHCAYDTCSGVLLAIRGFTTMLDLFDSFQPRTGSFGFRVPQRPEGMKGADYFDTYWGEVTRPLDFSLAQPWLCSYPTSPPKAGDYLPYPDIPRPAPGHANYALTSVTYLGQTRAGRQAIDGLHGRDGSVLPACVVKEVGNRTKNLENGRSTGQKHLLMILDTTIDSYWSKYTFAR